MTLKDALQIISSRSNSGNEPVESVFLACGFTPLHLQTFFTACLKQRWPEKSVQILTGLYGDLQGNVSRAAASKAAVAVLVEWPDLDPRLGMRQSGGWGELILDDVLTEAEASLARLFDSLAEAAAKAPVVVCGPTLPLPPFGHTRNVQATLHELKLRALVDQFLLRCGALHRVRVLPSTAVDRVSAPAERYDIKTELYAGFPYRNSHASAIAALLTEALYPPAPKKGLVLDLDNTVWSGIVGEIGPENVCWDLNRKAQVHALLQQQAAAFAQNGVLVAIASKNDPSVVAEAFRRKDILLTESAVFPLEVNWGPKSESIGRILRQWNIGADSVVFVDDSPMELAEVKEAYPAIECLQFVASDAEKVLALLIRLKDLFGKETVGDEDRLRAASLRSGAEFQQAAGAGKTVSVDFLAGMKAVITVDSTIDPSDTRTYELVNKTNQFNLNGRRYTESEWRAALERPGAFLAGISYEDKFGPLGKIAVVMGVADSGTLRVDAWVMSCRAFSRRIEHHTLDWLFNQFGAGTIRFDHTPTSRNMPLQEFWESLFGQPAVDADLVLTEEQFRRQAGDLPHTLRMAEPSLHAATR